MKALRFISLIIIIIFALLVAIPVMAQDGDTPETPEDAFLFEITGVILISDDGNIMIDDLIIAPAGAFNPSIIQDFEEGQEVTITGYLLNDDTLQALTFVLAEDDDTEECDVSEDDADAGDDTTDDADEGDDTEETDDPCEDDDTEECDVSEDDADAGDDTTDDADEGDDTEETDDPCEDDDTVNLNPVGVALADEFELEYEQIAEWRDLGLGYGEIARALLLAEQLDGVSVDDILAQLDELGGWGQVMQQYDVNPSDLAPGRIISNRSEDAGNNGNGNNDNGNNGNGNNDNGNNGNGNNGNGNNGNGNNGNGNNGNGNNGNGNNGNGNNGNGNNGNGNG